MTMALPVSPAERLAEHARRYTDATIEELARIMQNGETDAVRVAAARELLDRGHGKSGQTVDVKLAAEVVSDFELARRIAFLLTKAAADDRPAPALPSPSPSGGDS